MKNRSYRRFCEEVSIKEDVLIELIDLARNCPSARNDQPLKYIISTDAKLNMDIFPALKWAGYLADWEGPGPGERPPAYILVLGDSRISDIFEGDVGIAMQSILLGAVEKGLGGCIIGSIDRKILRKLLKVPEYLKILYVIVLGKPNETIILHEVGLDGDIRYWRDENGHHHVPKRSLKEILVRKF